MKLTSGAIYCMSGEGKRRDMRVAVRAPVSQVSVTLAGAGQLAAHARTHTHTTFAKVSLVQNPERQIDSFCRTFVFHRSAVTIYARMYVYVCILHTCIVC